MGAECSAPEDASLCCNGGDVRQRRKTLPHDVDAVKDCDGSEIAFVEDLTPRSRAACAQEECIAGFVVRAESLDRLFKRGVAAFADVLEKSTYIMCFYSWKTFIGNMKFKQAEKHTRIVRKFAARFVSHSTTQMSKHCFRAWHEIAVDRRLDRQGYALCLSPFKLEKGDQVIVNSDGDKVKALCEGDFSGSRGGWNIEKALYLGHAGEVIGWDWVGHGVRVRFSDGHWWSFAPEALHVKVEPLPSHRKQLLESMAV